MSLTLSFHVVLRGEVVHRVPFRTSPFEERSRSSEGSTEREQDLQLGVVVVFSVLCSLAV